MEAAVIEQLESRPTAGLPPRTDNIGTVLSLPPPNPFLPTYFGLVGHAGYGALLGLSEAGSSPYDAAGPGLSLLEVASGAVPADAADWTKRALLAPNSSELHAMLLPAGRAASATRDEQMHFLRESPLSLWWLPDVFFGRPRSHVAIELLSPPAAASATAAVLTALWVDAVQVWYSMGAGHWLPCVCV
jgi:secreted Zn-dependent insulinase-like peptidase